jgi:hypothetical protein
MQEPTEIETRCKRLPRDWPWGAVYKAQVDGVGMYVVKYFYVLCTPSAVQASQGPALISSARANANANAAL